MTSTPYSHTHERIYFGESEASALLSWLNSGPPKKPMAAVTTFLQMSAQLAAETRRVSKNHDPAAREAQLANLKAVYDAVGRLVSQHGVRYRTTVVPEVFDGGVQWIEREVVARVHVGSRDVGIPRGVFASLTGLANMGVLDRVRKCERPECGKWFFARFEHAQFDSVSCRRQTRRADPNWQKKRAAYMQRWRRVIKRLHSRKKPKGGK